MKSIFTNKNKREKALKKIPFLIPMVAQSTLSEPGASLYQFMQDYEQKHNLHLDFAQGFPLADVAEVGPSIIAYADTAAEAKSALSDFYKKIVAKQDQYNVKYFSPIEAVKKAKTLTADAYEKVILVDTQDNAGCGGTGDTTGLLQAMCDQSLENSILGLLCDPEVAKLAHKEGIGATFKASLGAKVFTQGIAPVVGEFEVLALSDGKFKATGPFYLNMQMDLGPMALLKINQVKVVVSSRKAQAADQAMFIHLGVDFSREKVIALKSTVHYQADFNALAKTHLIVETPGSNIANLGRLSYQYAKQTNN